MKKKLFLPVIATAAFPLVLGACSLAPDFSVPKTDTPARFRESGLTEPLDIGRWKVAAPAAHLPRGDWWTVFEDETLNALQAEAAKENLTLEIMAARVRQARATVGVANSSLFPNINGSASATREKPSSIRRGMGGGDLPIENTFDLGAVINYEVDLFGRVQNTRTAAKADARRMEETYQSVRLALQADVAELYFTLRALDAERDLMADTLNLRQDSLGILRRRFDAGIVTELELAEYVVDLENTRSQYQAVLQQRKEAEHALAVLLGVPPSAFSLGSAGLPAAVPAVPPGLPSALLERRPDIAAAQHALAAANARIGVARAAFFPSLSLTGSGGTVADVVGDLFKWSSRTWAIGPVASLPIFRAGASRANLERSRAVYDESVAEYRLTVLEAFRDVEDSLSRLTTFAAQGHAQDLAEAAALRAADLAGKRYDSGALGYLEAITARRNALDVQRSGIRLQGSRLTETVRLIRALGGGWETASAPAATLP